MCFLKPPNLTPKERAYDTISAILEGNVLNKLLLQISVATSPTLAIRNTRIETFLESNKLPGSLENIEITLNLLGVKRYSRK